MPFRTWYGPPENLPKWKRRKPKWHAPKHTSGAATTKMRRGSSGSKHSSPSRVRPTPTCQINGGTYRFQPDALYRGSPIAKQQCRGCKQWIEVHRLTVRRIPVAPAHIPFDKRLRGPAGWRIGEEAITGRYPTEQTEEVQLCPRCLTAVETVL